MSTNLDVRYLTPAGFTSQHQGVDHTAAPFNLLSAAAHQAVDNTAAPFNLLNATAHQGVDHKAAPFNLLDEAAHDLLDHTSLPGAGLSTKQQIILPSGQPYGRWWPSTGSVAVAEGMQPTATSNPEQFAGLTTVSALAGPTSTYEQVSGFGPSRRYVVIANASVLLATDLITHASILPRIVFKVSPVSLISTSPVEFGIGTSAAVSLFTATDALFAAATVGSGWTVERRIGSATQPSTPTGIAAITPMYVVIEYTTPTDATVKFYNVATLALLFTATFTGAQTPTGGPFVVEAYFRGDSPGSATIDFGAMLLSHNI